MSDKININADSDGFWNPTAEGIKARLNAFKVEDARREKELSKYYLHAMLAGVISMLVYTTVMIDFLPSISIASTLLAVTCAVFFVMLITSLLTRKNLRTIIMISLLTIIVAIYVVFYFILNARGVRFYGYDRVRDIINLLLLQLLLIMVVSSLYGLVKAWLVFGNSRILRIFVQLFTLFGLAAIVLFFVIPFTSSQKLQVMVDSPIHRVIFWVLFFAWRIAAAAAIAMLFVAMIKRDNPVWKERCLQGFRVAVALALIPFIWGVLRISLLCILEWTFPEMMFMDYLIIFGILGLPLITAFVVFDLSGRLALIRWRKKVRQETERMKLEFSESTPNEKPETDSASGSDVQ